jgi:hypothetical protein
MSAALTQHDWDGALLLRQFESCELPAAQFKHRQHVQLAWTLLAQLPMFTALQRFRRALKAFARHNNVPGLYNETITCFYLLQIRERMDRLRPGQDWHEFAAQNPDLFTHPRNFLQAWYPGDSAFADAAKAAFILPAAT